MYRWLLCCRYLRTRYIALASIISVTLGVATLIVVNSVMAGFAEEMHRRMHGILSDVVIDSFTSEGLVDPDRRLAEIRSLLGDDLVGATTVVHVPAMLRIDQRGQSITRQINLIGIDRKTYGTVSDFDQYLLHPQNREGLSFQLRESGYPAAREMLADAGWKYRRALARAEKQWEAERKRLEALAAPARGPAAGPSVGPAVTAHIETPAATFDPEHEQYCGIVLGIASCSTKYRKADGQTVEHFYARPGDDIWLGFPAASEKLNVIDQRFTVVDLYESGMSEYDSTFAFVPLEQLQKYRGMIDPETGRRSVTSIQLKLRDGADLDHARDLLRAYYPANEYLWQIQTWRDMQGPLLAAVQLETTILNLLLFLIIAVAGFGILATFFMIVIEKTRDIGILKSLGASGAGVMSIFLSYGLLLGIVGAGVGVVGGLLFVHYINDIAGLIEVVTGQEVFDPTVYYFNEIPTIVQPLTVVWVSLGAVGIAVLASVLPALRAARMHPVAALRYE